MTPQGNAPLPGEEYARDSVVTPSLHDDKLWRSVYNALLAQYPDRLLLEHARMAFEAVCAGSKKALPFGNFLRKVRLHWLWKRPPAPRGVAFLE